MSLLTTASLVITPNAGKEGTLFSVVPNTSFGDMSVTRATTATRVNSSGLVELVPYNLVTYSEQFNNADWTKGNGTITANATTSPDGTANADKFAEDSSTDAHYFGNDTATATSGQSVTFTIFAKQSERSWIAIRLYSGFGSIFGYYNIANGTLGTIGAGGVGNIEDYGNGWYRCSLTITMVSNSVCLPYVFSSTGNGTITFTGTTGSGVFVWGAQLVEGSVAKDYQKTETRLNIPRLDYSNGTCPSLLVEPQRTNVQPYSEDLSQVGIENGSVTTNVITSPSGIQNADLYTENTTTSYHRLNNGTLTYVSGQSYTFSVYAKANGTGRYLIINASSAFNARSFFDLNSGTIALIDSGTASIKDMGNGWYRCSVTNSRVYGTSSDSMYFGLSTGLTDSAYTGNGTTGFYAWGMQIEAGSYPTSYIPTTSASVTRNADVISKTGISSLIGQTEGTLFWEGQGNTQAVGNDLWLFESSVNDTDNAVLLYYVHSSGYINNRLIKM